MFKRVSKRDSARFGGSYSDRVPIEDDYETVQAHTASRTAFNHTAAIEIENFFVPSPWTVGDSWAPEDNDDFSLDPSDEWYDEALEAEVGDVMEDMALPKPKRKRHQASVSRVHIPQ